MRRPFVGGNWKMNTNGASAAALARSVSGSVAKDRLSERVDVAVFPPFVYLRDVVGVLPHGASPAIGAQDVYFQPDGAFTGEVSVSMLKDCGVSIVLAGHSERRHIIGESDETVNKKVRSTLAGGLSCVLCVGEKLEERQRAETDRVNERQLRAGLAGVSAEQMRAVVIAYEPVWAIGTGKVASAADAQDAHAKIRMVVADLFGRPTADSTRIIYGGSVSASATLQDLAAQPDVDGGLVGGASLKPDDFQTIIRAVADAKSSD